MAINTNYNKLELDNNGERLVPGYSHDMLEIIRHKSTYQLFKEIIIQDILNNPEILKKEIKILDLGCGTGHGTFLLSAIPNSKILAIDISKEAISFAKENYFNENIEYNESSLEDFINKNSNDFDYIVSRGALEHIEDGINTALKINYNKRFMISVPYKEPEGINPFHILSNIDENSFPNHSYPEFFYEDLNGKTYINSTDNNINCFTCVLTKEKSSPISKAIKFPLKAYELKGLEKIYCELLEEEKKKITIKRIINKVKRIIEDILK